MPPRRSSARLSLIAVATAVIAVLAAAPSAGAASFTGGTFKIDLKLLKGVTVSTNGASPTTSSGGTFKFAPKAGSATLTKQATGSLHIGLASSSVTITKGKHRITLQSFVEKLSAGRGQLTAKISGKGKAIAFFNQASANRVGPSDGFTSLSMRTSGMRLTQAGAAALNKALALDGRSAIKENLKVGSASFTAERLLTVTGGSSRAIYDAKFVQDLRACDVALGPVAPGTAIAKDPTSAPEGGVTLPITGGVINARRLAGAVQHAGGTLLQRPEGAPSGKPAYSSALTNFDFGFGGPSQTLTAVIVNLGNSVEIGNVEGTLSSALTSGGGTVNLSGALALSTAASNTLSSTSPPQGPQVGADCTIPPGSKIGAVTMSADVD